MIEQFSDFLAGIQEKLATISDHKPATLTPAQEHVYTEIASLSDRLAHVQQMVTIASTLELDAQFDATQTLRRPIAHIQQTYEAILRTVTENPKDFPDIDPIHDFVRHMESASSGKISGGERSTAIYKHNAKQEITSLSGAIGLLDGKNSELANQIATANSTVEQKAAAVLEQAVQKLVSIDSPVYRLGSLSPDSPLIAELSEMAMTLTQAQTKFSESTARDSYLAFEQAKKLTEKFFEQVNAHIQKYAEIEPALSAEVESLRLIAHAPDHPRNDEYIQKSFQAGAMRQPAQIANQLKSDLANLGINIGHSAARNVG